MPYWTPGEVGSLIKMLDEGVPLGDISLRLRRSQEAVKMKMKRMGLEIPKSVLRNAENKVTMNATTTTKIEPVTPEELPSALEALQLLWSAVQRLKDPDVSPGEVKKIRLMISSIKTYAHLHAGYLLRLEKMEQSILLSQESNRVHLKALLEQERNPAKKAEIEGLIKQLEENIASMKAGPQVPAKLKTALPP